MFTHKITSSYTTDQGQIVAATSTVTQPVQSEFDNSVAISTTEVWSVTITHSKLQSILIYSDKAVTVKTFTGGTGGTNHDTIAVAAGQLIAWNSASTGASPITADSDTISIQNASGTNVANPKIYILQTL